MVVVVVVDVVVVVVEDVDVVDVDEVVVVAMVVVVDSPRTTLHAVSDNVAATKTAIWRGDLVNTGHKAK